MHLLNFCLKDTGAGKILFSGLMDANKVIGFLIFRLRQPLISIVPFLSALNFFFSYITALMCIIYSFLPLSWLASQV